MYEVDFLFFKEKIIFVYNVIVINKINFFSCDLIIEILFIRNMECKYNLFYLFMIIYKIIEFSD